MKKKLAYFALTISLATTFAAPLAVHAESMWGIGHAMASDNISGSGSGSGSTSGSGDSNKSTTQPPTTEPTTTTPSTSTTPPSTTPPTTDDSSGRASRIEKEKKDLKETLTDADKTHIADRCVAAQGTVKKKTSDNQTATTSRTAAYADIVAKLQALVTTAKAQSVDVTELQGEITTLQAKITTFTTANTTYQQALTDLAALDCKTDPVAFKAALVTARTDQQAVLAAAKDIRTYLTATVKPTLEALKSKLSTAQ